MDDLLGGDGMNDEIAQCLDGVRAALSVPPTPSISPTPWALPTLSAR
jgi:hypothetical protein